ncbi:BcNRPS1, nonribosomal peptide synthetase [Glonium stellatum]|uniref:BcNRPS1, nonribosomal peptide synthetase n=1 Tax=Glonium stellatum TaxID=574774 RepID=A0A8E2JRB6_9PEZI|nr:BcNRPS1, nonribosomal peptide synthetase [Glonium stellatum]
MSFHLGVPMLAIDHNSSFIQNGGDSLSAIKLSSSCRLKGISLPVEAILTSTRIAVLLEYAEQQKNFLNETHKYSVELARRGKYDVLEQQNMLLKFNLDSHKNDLPAKEAPVTDMQSSLLHGSQNTPGRNIVRYHETYRPNDIPAVRKAWHTVVSTEPIFRVEFQLFNVTDFQGKYCMVENSEAYFDWKEATVHNQQSYETQLLYEDLGPGFIGTAFRVAHLKDEGGHERSTVTWIIHHAIIDAYSSVLVLNKVRKVLAGDTIYPGPSFVGLIQELGLLQKDQQTTGLEFWVNQREAHQDAVSKILLPAPQNLSQALSASREFSIDISLSHLSGFARQSGVTIASVCYAAWALTLSKYADSNDVSFGAVLCGRDIPLLGAQETIGPMINTVPFCISLDKSNMVSAYLQDVFSYTVKIASFQWAVPSSGFSSSFSTALSVHFETPLLEANPIDLLEPPSVSVTSDIPLSVDVQTDGRVRIYFRPEFYHGDDVEHLGGMFVKAIELLTKPDHPLESCSRALVTVQQRDKLHDYGNCFSSSTTLQHVRYSLIDLFNTTLMQNPDRIALKKGNTTVTYSELDSSSTVVARKIGQWVNTGDVVYVHADRSINWIIAIYGALKIGAIYCPLDEALPRQVRNENFVTGGGRLFLAGSTADKVAKPLSCTLTFAVEELLAEPDTDKADPQLTAESPGPSANAYLCFTSGSTGRPKGVLCTHHSLVAFQKCLEVRLSSRPGWRIAQTMSPAFDGSIHEIFSALSYGSTLVLRGSPDPFSHLADADTAVLTPSIAKVLNPADFPFLSSIYLVGEAVPQSVCDTWASRMTVYNMYGPTEATCGATIKRLSPQSSITLGKPNASTRVYILDNEQQFTPLGVIGEIYLAGIQVSNGYIHNPEETAKKFLRDSVRLDLDERMYRTGDRGYWDADGELHHVGRSDRQIKLRGFRIDLDDLETRIQNILPSCSAVAVTHKEDYLIAHVQPEMLDACAIKKAIAQTLPWYAVPRHIIAVSQFPRTNAGKLDYKEIACSSIPVDAAPSQKLKGTTEEKIAEVWRELLGLTADYVLTSDSNFLELGGHSVAQLLLVNRLRLIFERPVSLQMVMKSATLRDLARKTESLTRYIKPATPCCSSSSDIISPMEQEWWVKYQLNLGTSAFTVSFAFKLGANINTSKLSDAWNVVLSRHSILRARYRGTATQCESRTYAETPPRVQEVLHLNIWEEIHRPFDLRHQSPIRVSVTERHLLIIASHIVCDFTTLRVLLREVACVHNGIPLAAPKPYRQPISQKNMDRNIDLNFWLTNLEALPKPNYSMGNWAMRISYSGSSHIMRLPSSSLDKLNRFSVSKKVTHHQIALAAVTLALQFQSDYHDIVIGAPLLNRTSEDTLEAVGLYLEPLPVRIRYPNENSKDDFVQIVQNSSQSALYHALPWNELVEYLQIQRRFPEHPLFDIMVSYHEDYGNTRMPGIDATPLYTWTEGAKFKLMVEFSVLSHDSLLMRLEYGDKCFDKKEIALLGRLILLALEGLVNGEMCENIKKKLRDMKRSHVVDDEVPDQTEFFGMEVDSLQR